MEIKVFVVVSTFLGCADKVAIRLSLADALKYISTETGENVTTLEDLVRRQGLLSAKACFYTCHEATLELTAT